MRPDHLGHTSGPPSPVRAEVPRTDGQERGTQVSMGRTAASG